MGRIDKLHVGIGFATGRKSFQKVLRSYLYNWNERDLPDEKEISLDLLVAYDLNYSNTKSTDYTNISQDLIDMVDETYFLGSTSIAKEISNLMGKGIVTEKEANLLFCDGYAGKRNFVVYTAMKNGIDHLVFLDDDEYPMAVTKAHSTAIWSGQQVIKTHLECIKEADITNGYHCGYISPIPYMEFNKILSEEDFRLFIEAISNDIINWDKMKEVMKNGGVTYADTGVLMRNTPEEISEVNHTKFISGANLCLNLTKPERLFPFYNPPGARGEDTFLSTCLSDRRVVKVPCYAFHDGFSTYNHLLDGVLPIKLKNVNAQNDQIITRFHRACIGWIRYKPLLLYITQQDHYEQEIDLIREKLAATLPKISAYFGKDSFLKIEKELERYHKNVEKHYKQFSDTKQAWGKICEHLSKNID